MEIKVEFTRQLAADDECMDASTRRHRGYFSTLSPANARRGLIWSRTASHQRTITHEGTIELYAAMHNKADFRAFDPIRSFEMWQNASAVICRKWQMNVN
ncbi:hypothetical protein OUZ56_005073 [Daphnia magna]|uniref:Uncharacterized protein n=2 Tax=Daphnia magna TaxID=35525 RepID=A0ABQ9YRR3_9CRUS|nr:hypothetical protein OUZ56_005073 [Daphnia magna]